MVELLERQTERIHRLMAVPAIRLAGDAHAVAEGLVRLVGQHRVDGDGDFGNRSPQQAFADPPATVNGVVVEVARVGHEPGGMRQQPQAMPGRHLVGHIGRPITPGLELEFIDRQGHRHRPILLEWGFGRGLRRGKPFVEVIGLFLETARVEGEREGLVGGQQFPQHIAVPREHPTHQPIGIGDKKRGSPRRDPVGPLGSFVFEDIGGRLVAEVVAKEPHHPGLGDGLVGEDSLDLPTDFVHGRQPPLCGSRCQDRIGLAVGQGQ